MDIRYKVTDMLRDSSGIVERVEVEIYLHGGASHLKRQLTIELGVPTGVPVPYADLTEATIKGWLMYNTTGMDMLVEASQQIQAESLLTSGLPWED